jgi:hypothetical protein
MLEWIILSKRIESNRIGWNWMIPKQVEADRDADDHEVRYLVPMLSNMVGDNNQLMEYMGAALASRATRRKLCLTPFFSGPPRHTSKSSTPKINE